MRHAYKIRLSQSDAIALDFQYSACQALDLRRYPLAAQALREFVGRICAARLHESQPLRPGWAWSWAGQTLYISLP